MRCSCWRLPERERERGHGLAAGELVDERSGLRARPGLLTMVVSAVPDETAALADRHRLRGPGEGRPHRGQVEHPADVVVDGVDRGEARLRGEGDLGAGELHRP